MTHERRDVALHEAGHAVAAYLLGRSIRRVTVVPDGEMDGGCLLSPQPTLALRLEEATFDGSWGGFIDLRTRRMVETEIMISMAGALTQMEATGAQDHETGAGIAALDAELRERIKSRTGTDPGDRLIVDGDWQKIVLLAGQVSGSDEEAGAYVDWLDARTRSLVRHPRFRPLVDALVEVLLERETLSGREVRVVLDDA